MNQAHASIRRPPRLAIALAASVLLAASGCAIVYVNPFFRPQGEYQEVEVQRAEGWLTAKKILVLDIDGVIVDQELADLLMTTESTVARIKEQLRKAEDDPLIRAVVLRLNTPGGGVTASDIIYRELVEFKARMRRDRRAQMPIVACIMDVGASGGYYVAMAADRVVIHRTGLTGSIGVIQMPYLTFDGLMKKIGVGSVTIKSGKHKDMGSWLRPMTDEERVIFQGIIDEMHDRFVEVVGKGRPKLDEDTIRKLADGRVYTAQQAKDAGLVDQVGYLDDAIKLAKIYANIDDARVIAYKRPGKRKENIYSAMAPGRQPSGSVNLVNVNASGLLMPNRPVFMYLWAPEL